KILRIPGNEHMLTVSTVNAFNASTSGNYRHSHRHGFEHLEPSSTTSKQGDHKGRCSSNILSDIWYRPRHIYMLAAPLQQRMGGITPHNMHGGFRPSSVYSGPYIIKKPHYPFGIGEPIERPDCDDPIGYRLARNVEKCKINTVWNNLAGCLRCHS